MHILKHPDHTIAWEKATFLDYDQNFYARRMKESFYIDMFSKSGTMNLEDGMLKKQCWNAIFQYSVEKVLGKVKDNGQIICVIALLIFEEKVIPTGHI